ncbi:MAG TPA: DUF192 domain-containing protein [Actinomycetota bacterium]|nr:DUF192 domain-containing protein [Actinomycetota bacterium]
MSGFPGVRSCAAALVVLALALSGCATGRAAPAPPSGGSSASAGSSPTPFDASGFASPTGAVANPAQSLPVGMLTISAGGHTKALLDVQIAATPESQSVGLMGITTLPPNLGMAFMFGESVDLAFWMEDTLIPLDIAFWNAGGKVVTVLSMVPCTANPCKLYSPSAPYVGAVEMQAGLIAKDGLATGDTVKLSK